MQQALAAIKTMKPSDIDPALAICLQRFAQLDAQTPTPQLDCVQRRRLLSELQARLLRRQGLAGIAVQNHFVSAPGREITVRSYMPSHHASGQTLVWLHGGGWMVGSLDTHDDLCEHLAHYSGHTVLSVHYRRTPENPFPAAVDDAQAVLHWLHQMQGVLPFASSKVLLGGDSAGGHLALATAVRAVLQQHTAHAQIQALLLLYPCLLPDLATPSVQAFAQGYGLTDAAMHRYWQALGGADDALRAPSLCTAALPCLPPTAIMTASHDILRDEAENFAHQLQALPQGPQCVLQRADGMVHGFARMLVASPAARQHVEGACRMLEQLRTS
ncbi:alpha/beta hydrolase [Comamonas aquatica]|nr:alpha/beta hydrolase [Comamonas aquatica]